MDLADRIIEIGRLGPDDRLVIHVNEDDPSDELLDSMMVVIKQVGLEGRALVLFGDMTLKVIALS